MTAPLRTAEAPTSTAEARARLRAAPPLEPPYDDDAPTPKPTEAPQLRIVQGLDCPDELPFGVARPGLRLACGHEPFDEADDPLFAPQPTPRDQLTDPSTHAVRILQGVLEVIARRRPLQQLLPLTTEDVYEQLTAWMYRTARSGQAQPAPPPSLRSVRVTEPADGIAEVAGVIHQETRVRAVALRLEGIDGRWQCTLFRML
jgi:hypothetical protein